MNLKNLEKTLSENEYPGRGIVIGKSEDGKYAVSAYWIMGRSENSRNRVFVEDGEGLRTQAFDESKMVDPHLIIYWPVRVLGNRTIVTNGDQTDTINDGLKAGKTFEQSLLCREFEDDAPNYTPRISGLMNVEGGKFDFSMSILKSDNGDGSRCNRFTYDYSNPKEGVGRYIHTYMGNGSPLPSFEGEPELVELKGNIDELTDRIWNSLNADNKVSLFVRYIDIATGKYESCIVNRNK